MADSIYFAANEANKTASTLLSRAHYWFNEIEVNGYLDKLREMWAAYHGAYYDSLENAHKITWGGEQGELANISINHIRNFASHMITMITSTRPSFEAKATNTDYKSLVQTKLANDLLEYYLREKRLEKYLKTACEYAVVLGSGFIKLEWNATTGEVYDYTEDGYPVYEGDIEFVNMSPFDVVFDDNIDTITESTWVLCRTFKNKYDIAAKYPELKEKILGLQTKADMYHYAMSSYTYTETDLVPIYEFYHKKTESMSDGRYLLFLEQDIILFDGPMPYRNLPVYRMSPSDIMGTPLGYTPLFDLLPIQDAINSLYSTALTNQSTFGVQNLWVPRGVDVSLSQLSGGLNVLEGNPQFGKPEAMNFTQTPQEVFNFMAILEKAAETVSGINSVTRGNPEASLKSGNALALVQSMSLQFISGLQQSYVQLIEDVGSGLINILRDFASVPRIAMIAGKDKRTYMKEFTGDDLSNVNRVIVDVGNPLSQTTAGRVQMAEQMLQMGLIKTPEQYFMVIDTGQLDAMTEDTQSELLLIKAENERLVSGDKVIAIATDQHSIHIKEHKVVLADPSLRFDPNLVQRVTEHIQEHINLLQTTDPNLLGMLGEKPLAPPGGNPVSPQGPQDFSKADVNGQAAETLSNPQAQTVSTTANISPGANIPTPPAPFNNNPVLPGQMPTR